MLHPGELTVVEKPLSKVEEKRFKELEGVINQNIKGFFLVWFALKEIHDKRLYRTADNRTFERYCEEEWDISRQRGYQYIEAAEVVINVQNSGHSDKQTDNVSVPENVKNFLHPDEQPPFPIKDSQARKLKEVPPEEQGSVWQRVCDTAQEKDVKITAKLVGEVVRDYKIEKFGEIVKDIQEDLDPPEDSATESKRRNPSLSPSLRTSFSETLQVIQKENLQGWRNSNKDLVVTWLRTLLAAAEEAR